MALSWISHTQCRTSPTAVSRWYAWGLGAGRRLCIFNAPGEWLATSPGGGACILPRVFMGGLLQARTKLGLNSSLALPWLFPPLCVGREAPPGNLCVSRFVPRGWIRLSSLGLIGLTTLIPPDPGFLGIPPFTLEGPISCISPDPSVVAMPECMAEYSGTPRATAKQDRGLRAVDLRFKIHLARGISRRPSPILGAHDSGELAL